VRVLVTGIDGFVGSHTAEFLLTLPGTEVHGTVLDPNQIRNISHLTSSLHLHQANILEEGRIEALLEDVHPDRIIHLAGQPYIPASLENPAQTFQVNIFGGISILEAARKLKESGRASPAILVVSTGEVYGRVDQNDQPITENSPLAPNNPYAASKACIDLLAQQYRTSFGLEVVVVRPFNHVGPRQSPAFVCSDFGKQFAEITMGKRRPEVHVGNVGTRRDFTDVRDIVRAYWSLFSCGSSEAVFNVCSGQAVQIREILAMYEEIAGVKITPIVEHRRLRGYEVPLAVGSNARLKEATGWSPGIHIRQTLVDVFEYWKRELASVL
jgi:GDP-4-dehydro-6-deoxy-D-mannose reductase